MDGKGGGERREGKKVARGKGEGGRGGDMSVRIDRKVEVGGGEEGWGRAKMGGGEKGKRMG